MKTKQTLHYFNIRGRAEPIRLLLNDLQIPFDEVGVDFFEWETAEIKKELPFGQLPLYVEEDSGEVFKMPQTQAILRYLARKHKLYGANTREEALCDVLQEAYIDGMNEDMEKYCWNDEFMNQKESLIASITKRFTDLEKVKPEGKFWVGNQVTYVDYCLWHYFDCVRATCGGENPLQLIAQFPKLYKFYQEFPKDRPNVGEYLKSSKRPKTITVAVAPFGGTVETS